MVKISPTLRPGRFIYFDVAQYQCTALRQSESNGGAVYVAVYLNGAHFAEFIVDAGLTIAAIRTMAARKIFDK
jgi:D-serine deaminase-like pyridoxal phosphate-dependent protein